MRNHLKNLAKDISGIFQKNFNKKYVLDIGCNDGTLLNYFHSKINKFGIDPSQIIKNIDKKKIKIFRDFFPPRKKNFKKIKIKFDIITSIAMFYDLPDPVDFAKTISNARTDKNVHQRIL